MPLIKVLNFKKKKVMLNFISYLLNKLIFVHIFIFK